MKLRTLPVFLLVALTACASSPWKKSWKGSDSPLKLAVERLAHSGKKVRIGVSVKVGTTIAEEKFAGGIKKWKQVVTNQHLGAYEAKLLEFAAGAENIRVIDRARMAETLKELRLSTTGLVAPSEQVLVGRQLGMTHMVAISFDRGISNKRMEDLQSVRLLEIETGTVLSTQHARMYR